MTLFTEDRSRAIRAALIDTVAATGTARRRKLWTSGLVVAGLVLGGGGATAAFAATGVLTFAPVQPTGQPTPVLPGAITAPASVTPGMPVVVLLAEPLSVPIDQAVSISLVDRPADATHAQATITAVTPGSVSFGTDDGGNNPSASWGASDDLASPTQYDFPLDDSVDTFYVEPSGFTGVVTVQYVTHIPTRLGINVRGQTFGATGTGQGEPDLIAVVATNGSFGYVERAELERVNGSEAAAIGESSPEPGQTRIPVYESDGVTVIGEFITG